MTSLDASLAPEWSLSLDQHGELRAPAAAARSSAWTITRRASSGASTSRPSTPRGIVYLNSEDGTLYGFDRNGSRRREIFLDTALGAAYTPVSIGPDGLLYAQNDGHLFAVGAAWMPSPRGADGERAPAADRPTRRVVR